MSSYDTVREIISLRIQSGVWKPGFRLPSTKALATEFGVSETLINQVMRSLTEAKLIVGIAGLGRFVAGTSEDGNDHSPVDSGPQDS